MSDERAEAHAAAEDAVADMLFGKEEVQETEEEYQPDPKPIEEGEDTEVEETTDESEEVEATNESEDGMVEVEFEGQIIEAPKAVAEALMRNKDYTEKTQEVAAQRKEYEIKVENLQLVQSQYDFYQQVQSDILQAQQLDGKIQESREYLKSNVEAMDAAQIAKWQLGISEAEAERDKIIRDVTQKNSEHQQAHQQSKAELMTKSTEVLRQKVPGWGEKHEADIREYALSLGVPEQTFNSVVDPTEKLILHKAMQYDALKAGAVPAVKTVQSAPTIKAKSRKPMPKETQDKLNLRKKLKNPNASNQEKADAVGLRLAEKFNM